MYPLQTTCTLDRASSDSFFTHGTRPFAWFFFGYLTFSCYHYFRLSYIHFQPFPFHAFLPSQYLVSQLPYIFCHQYKVVSIQKLPWKSYPETSCHYLHYYNEQQRAQNRSLMQSNLYFEAFTVSTLRPNQCFCTFIHRHYCTYLPFALCFSCICLITKIASVVPFPLINPNCMSSILTCSLILFSITFSTTFIACSRSLIALYDPHSNGSPLPL